MRSEGKHFLQFVNEDMKSPPKLRVLPNITEPINGRAYAESRSPDNNRVIVFPLFTAVYLMIL